MIREKDEIKLENKETSELIPAGLYRGVDSHNIEDFRTLWLPMFEELKVELKIRGIFIEDSHWDWEKKLKSIRGELAYNSFVIEADKRTQGMMIINNAAHYSWIEIGKPLIYIEFLATAPWNRKLLVEKPVLGGVGKLLFVKAIIESLQSDFEGRVGLHSLPGAVSWYTYLGMRDFGEDRKKQSLHYFELDKITANNLLKELNN